MRGHRGRPDRGRARLRDRAALDLRHPGRVRAAGRRGDAPHRDRGASRSATSCGNAFVTNILLATAGVATLSLQSQEAC